MFVHCLPNPHVNTMEHLQRRNSSSAGCNSKGAESSAGSAKKVFLSLYFLGMCVTVLNDNIY